MKKSVLVLSYERPIYLWNTLDSLYRSTKSDVDITLVDQGSTDPLVDKVIRGFVSRGLIGSVVKREGNDPLALQRLLAERFESLSDVFFYVESDVVIYEQERCWTDRFLSFMDSDPALAMLGSKIDVADFVSRETLVGLLEREPSKDELNAIKWFSSERRAPPIADDEIASPHNPPGRLLALRKSAIRDCPSLRDGPMHDHLLANGWKTGVTGAVRHRHLSLFNFFDFPEYNMQDRDDYMKNRKQ